MADDIQKGTVESKEQEFNLIDPESLEETSESPLPTEEDLSDPVEESPEEQPQEEEVVDEQPDELSDVDNPKSYKHFQSLYNKERERAEKEREEKIRLEERLKAFEERTSPKEEQSPQEKSLEPPQKPTLPSNYSEYDAFTDPDSESFKYRKAKEDYNEKMIQYQADRLERLNGTFQQEQEAKAQREKMAQQKAFVLSEFQKNGADTTEAQKAYEWIASGESGSFENLLKFYRFVNSTPKTNRKEVIEKRGQRKDENVLPLGAVPSETEPAQDTGDFWGDLSKQRHF